MILATDEDAKVKDAVAERFRNFAMSVALVQIVSLFVPASLHQPFIVCLIPLSTA